MSAGTALSTRKRRSTTAATAPMVPTSSVSTATSISPAIKSQTTSSIGSIARGVRTGRAVPNAGTSGTNRAMTTPAYIVEIARIPSRRTAVISAISNSLRMITISVDSSPFTSTCGGASPAGTTNTSASRPVMASKPRYTA